MDTSDRNPNINVNFDLTVQRRLPIYLLLDTSASMTGTGIEAVNQGIEIMISELRRKPYAVETAYVSVITFNTAAAEVIKLTEVLKFNIPTLSADGITNFGAGLRTLTQAMKRDINLNMAQRKGDWRPLVFIFTDGNPTDEDWPVAADELKGQMTADIIALGCGEGIDKSVLHRVAGTVYLMEDLTSDRLIDFFKWISQSIGTVSKSVQQGKESATPTSAETIQGIHESFNIS